MASKFAVIVKTSLRYSIIPLTLIGRGLQGRIINTEVESGNERRILINHMSGLQKVSDVTKVFHDLYYESSLY